MHWKRINRKRLMAGCAVMAALPFLVYCTRSTAAKGDAAAPEATLELVFQMSDSAGAVYGGFYAARELGYFESENVRVRLVPGGPLVDTVGRLRSGRAQIADMGSDRVYRAVEQGADLVIIGALLQHEDRVLMVRDSGPVRTLEDLSGRHVNSSADWMFPEYVKRKFGIEFEHSPVDLGYDRLRVVEDWIQEGNLSRDPYPLRRQGLAVRCLSPWDAGYDAMVALVVERGFALAHADALERFMRALARGQQAYFEGDPLPAHRAMLVDNKSTTLEFLEWSRAELNSTGLAQRDLIAGKTAGYLSTDAARIARQIEQARKLGALEGGELSAEKVLETGFLPAAEKAGEVAINRPN